MWISTNTNQQTQYYTLISHQIATSIDIINDVFRPERYQKYKQKSIKFWSFKFPPITKSAVMHLQVNLLLESFLTDIDYWQFLGIGLGLAFQLEFLKHGKVINALESTCRKGIVLLMLILLLSCTAPHINLFKY